MKQELTRALNECLALLKQGEATLDECLGRYPGYASELRPLLETALEVHELPRPTSNPEAFAAGKERMLAALADRKRRQAESPRSFAHHIAALLRRQPRGRKGLPAWTRTPAFQIATAGAMVLLLFCIGGFFLLFRPQTSTVTTARLEQVHGAVGLMDAGSDTWRSTAAGDQVMAGGRIRTGPLSSATLIFCDGSKTVLQDETEVAVVRMSARRDGDRDIVLRQTLGRTYSRVQRAPGPASHFEIETPAAVAAVRGTEFTTVVAADGTTRVRVTEGLVEVTAQGRTVTVLDGQETAVYPGRLPSTPASIPQATPTPTATSAPDPTEIATSTCAPAPITTSEPASAPQSTEPGCTPRQADPDQQAPQQPPGLTKTPQPPGLTKTPQPPGQDKKPKPPGHDKKPKPKKKSRLFGISRGAQSGCVTRVPYLGMGVNSTQTRGWHTPSELCNHANS